MGRGWIVFALCVSSFYFCEAQNPRAQFSNTIVQGIVKKTRKGRDVDSFMGIPYAEPPVGDLRFRNPTPKVYPDGNTLMADQTPKQCLQSKLRAIGDGSSPRDSKGDEDCLYLNVYRPASAEIQSLPVMVYFEAAELIPGTDDIAHIGPDYLLDKDIILVTLTYRLGVFGFLTTGDEAAPGNFGLKDQTLALQWIQSNIAGFGGDPDRVTLFGQGEAAKSIHLQTLVSHTAGLFHQYILQSGSALALWTVRNPKIGKNRTEKLASLNGCPTDSSSAIVGCLREIDSKKLLESSFEQFSLNEIGLNDMWAATIESDSPGAFLTECPEDIITRGDQKDMPFIAGFTPTDSLYSPPAGVYGPYFERKFINSVLDLLDKISGSNDNLERRIYSYYRDPGASLPVDWTINVNMYALDIVLPDFPNDLFYYYPQFKMLEERRLNSRAPIYFYKFEYKGAFSMTDWVFDTHDVDDVGTTTHGDDLLYLFAHDTSKFPDAEGFEMYDEDYEVIDIMVELWTSFATQGAPRSQRVDNWGPYDSEGQYLLIGNKTSLETAMITERFEPGEMEFWTKVTLPACD